MKVAAAEIRAQRGYRWVGIYEVTPNEIAILAWDGPSEPAHPRFARTEGLCGAAVAGCETIVVDDVATDPRYLTTFGTTRSELVVPIIRGGSVVGVVDVESDRPKAFTDDDRALVEQAAARLANEWDG